MMRNKNALPESKWTPHKNCATVYTHAIVVFSQVLQNDIVVLNCLTLVCRQLND